MSSPVIIAALSTQGAYGKELQKKKLIPKPIESRIEKLYDVDVALSLLLVALEVEAHIPEKANPS
jgi:hypothetical protein